MKKLAVLLFLLVFTIGVITSCGPMFVPLEDDSSVGDDGSNDSSNLPDGDKPSDGDVPDKPPTEEYKYTAFTADELALIADYFDFEIPFIPTNDYGIEPMESTDERGICYYTVGNTKEEFERYLDALDFELFGEETDEEGDTWYYFDIGDACFDIVYYEYEGESYIEAYVYNYVSDGDDTTGGDAGEEEEQGYLIKCSNAAGTYYFNGTTQNGKFGATDNSAEAAIVFLEKCEGGYLIYFYDGGNKTYVVMNDGSSQGNFTEFATSATVFEWNEYVGTYVVAEDSNNRAFGMKPDSVAAEFSSYDSSNKYNFGEFVRAPGATLPDDGGTTPPPAGDYLYNSFLSSELAALKSFAGFTIPFIPTNDYGLDEYTYENEVGLNYYTYGNTKAEFMLFLDSLEGFTSAGSEADEDGDIWYYYDRGEYMLDAAWYVDADGNYVIDVYLFIYENEGGSGSDGSDTTDSDLITNAGAGLPEGTDGVYEIVFTDALYVKDVTDQGNYIDGCPTTGKSAVLVIPVDFSDRTASSLGYKTSVLEGVLGAGSTGCDYYSLHDFYYTSSYGQLDLQITVLSEWFRPANTSEYYAKQTMDYYGEQTPIGDQLIMDEALAYLEPKMDLSKFDSDGNGVIDSVILVNTLEINSDDNYYWAYRYWNIYTDSSDYYYEYDGVSANDYIWMSYQFIFETTDIFGNVSFDDKNARCPYTFIHEFGHILGADDYYDTAGVHDPLGGYDIMDSMSGDHNAFTKINYGWIKRSRLVTTDTSVTLSLEDFSKAGDTIIIGANFDPKLGAYQEYYILMYYTCTGLNGGEYGYFDKAGVVVYHINASLYSEVYEGETYYDIYNNNTDASDTEYGTEDDLITFAKSSIGGYTYVAGDTPAKLLDYAGNSIGYTFKVDSISSESATITFTKI